eukprot:359506-Pyramimonas_sp.AAC.1
MDQDYSSFKASGVQVRARDRRRHHWHHAAIDEGRVQRRAAHAASQWVCSCTNSDASLASSDANLASSDASPGGTSDASSDDASDAITTHTNATCDTTDASSANCEADGEGKGQK